MSFFEILSSSLYIHKCMCILHILTYMNVYMYVYLGACKNDAHVMALSPSLYMPLQI